MKKTLLVVFSLALVLIFTVFITTTSLASGDDSTSDDPMAVLTGFEGEVSVSLNGDALTATPGMPLQQLSGVSTGEGATAYILYSNNDMVVIDENSEHIIDIERGGTAAHAFPDDDDMDTSDREFTRLMMAGNYGWANSDKRQLYPVGATSMTRPIFTWLSDEGEDVSYDVTVAEVTSDKRKQIFEAKDVTSPFDYPADAPKLELSKKYEWTLTVSTASEELLSQTTSFDLIGKEKSRQLMEEFSEKVEEEWNEGTSLYVRGNIYRDHLLCADAARMYRGYLDLYPSSKIITTELLLCYEEMELNALANTLAKEFFLREN